ncbi:GAF domain-containing protein [Candidatus Leptofilum sp.]|uniref:sensor histidine kinase n=1 Tax=Candidatus Leptofilum sp. TaxID=3241576 RepID=UPI003B5C044B
MDHSIQDAEYMPELRDSERLHTLYVVNHMLKQVEADGLNIKLMLPRVLNLSVQQLEADDGSIIVVNETQKVEHAWLTGETTQPIQSEEFLETIMNSGVAGWVIRNHQPLIIHDTQNDERWLPRPGHTTSHQPWSVICTPFSVRDRVIGAITIHKLGTNQFDERDLSLLTAISNQAASSIENARLFEASQRQLTISALLNEASRVINSSLDINEIMQSLLAQMNDFLNAEAISIALVDVQTNELVYQVAEGIGAEEIVGLRLPSNQGLSGWVMQHSEPALVANTRLDPRFHHLGDKRTGYSTLAMICAPMIFKGDVLGTIQAINPIDGTFTEQDLDVLVNLANIASTAIANAQQYARTVAAESRYTSLFQDSVDPIILTDLRGHIVEANRRASDLWGFSRSDLLNMSIQDLHPETAVLPKAKKIRSDKVIMFHSNVRTKNANPIPMEVYTKRTSHGEGQLLQWIHHDISEQVELEKMREDLTAMLFHDLQSPLGNVISSLELLAYEIPTEAANSPLYAMLDIARRSSRRLETLIRSLLDINRLEAGQPIMEQVRVNMNDLVNEVYEIEFPNFEQRRVHFANALPDELPHVFVEEDMIRRVLVNLVNNALKYSSEDQTITLSAQVQPENDRMHLSVSDEGQGIPKQYRESVFEKFERIQAKDSKAKGLGLGLAFCRLAVEAHNGRIWVDDAPSGGARFNFTLPLATD